MGWPYHFSDLNLEQKTHRRQLLDWYGSLAQISFFVPLLALQCYFLVGWVKRRWEAGKGVETPSSPVAKERRSGREGGGQRVGVVLARVAWWAGHDIRVLGSKFGTNGEVLGATVWMVWLLLLCFVQAGDDYLHLTKRFGIVAASQLPLLYLLALKSPFSPLQVLTRSSHETLNSLHQLLGKIITLLLYSHAALYINFYIASNLLAAKVQELYVIAGIVGIIAFTAVGTTALTPVRKWSYRVFYITHVTLATALLPVLFFHVSHIRIYLYETAAVYALSAALRHLNTQTLPGTIRLLPGTALLEIDIPLPKHHAVTKWQAGQHAYVSLAGHPFLRTFKSNPFTVASIPTVDGRLRFIAKVLDGNTAKLARTASSRESRKPMHSLTIEGPYGVVTHADRLLQSDRILLIAGGVGATFIVPLYRQLLADLSPSKGSYRRQRVGFTWVARSRADVMWALPADGKEREGFVERLRVYLTGSTVDGGSAGLGKDSAVDADDGEGDAAFGEPEEGIELEEQKKLLSGESDEDIVVGDEKLQISRGRPDLPRIIEQAFIRSSTGKVAVVFCGPHRLGQAVRKEVGRYVGQGREVWLWDESFAL